jgi:hypothetical protein
MGYICKLPMNYVLGKRIFNILNHVIFPVFMFDLRMISISSECEYDWFWKISACSTEYEACDSFASLTRQQTSYSGSACWYFRYPSIHIQIPYTYVKLWSPNVITPSSLRSSLFIVWIKTDIWRYLHQMLFDY